MGTSYGFDDRTVAVLVAGRAITYEVTGYTVAMVDALGEIAARTPSAVVVAGGDLSPTTGRSHSAAIWRRALSAAPRRLGRSPARASPAVATAKRFDSWSWEAVGDDMLVVARKKCSESS